MKVISDIRVYKNMKFNEYGIPQISDFSNKELNIIIHRVVMKLRENNFSFDDFDHLYIVFTNQKMKEQYTMLDYIDKYHPWYRYCIVSVNDNVYEKIESGNISNNIVLEVIENVLVTKFSTVQFSGQAINRCFAEAIDQQENMLMKYKTKENKNICATIYLRLANDGKYWPLLIVKDIKSNVLLEKDLPKSVALDYIGNIKILKKEIIIQPKSNAYTIGMTPLVFKL